MVLQIFKSTVKGCYETVLTVGGRQSRERFSDIDELHETIAQLADSAERSRLVFEVADLSDQFETDTAETQKPPEHD